MKKMLRASMIVCLVLAMLCGTVLTEGSFSGSAIAKERMAGAKAEFLSSPYLYGASNLRISPNGLKARLSWSPDQGSYVSGYVVFRCQRSYSRPSNTPYGWFTLHDGYYWYPVSLIGTTTSTYMDIVADLAGTYYIEVDSYYLSYNSYVSSHGEFATFYASGSSTTSVSAPSTVKAKQTANNKVKLTWTAGEGAKSYAVYRATGSGSFQKIGTTKKLSYTDKKAKNGKTYKYKIQAINGSKKKYSKAVKAYPMAKPGSVKVKNNGNGTITLSWGKVAGAKKYVVYQKAPGNSSFSEVTSTTSKKVTISAYNGNGTYKFYVLGAVGSFMGMQSSTVSTTVSGGSPDVPSSVKYRALIVANTYTGNSTLNGTANDAKAMKGALEGLSQNWNVTVKRNVDANEILSAIYSTFSGADSDDVCLFYYSGHGVTSPGEYSGALCGNSGGNYVSMSELADALDSACPGKVIVLLDSCGSGAGINKSEGSAAAMTQAAIKAFSGKNSMLTDKYGELCEPKFSVLAAASMHTSSYDLNTSLNGYNCGAFTYCLLTQMGATYPNGSYSSSSMAGDSNGDRALSLKEAYNGICSLVSQYGFDDEGNQCTQYYGDNNMILFKR